MLAAEPAHPAGRQRKAGTCCIMLLHRSRTPRAASARAASEPPRRPASRACDAGARPVAARHSAHSSSFPIIPLIRPLRRYSGRPAPRPRPPARPPARRSKHMARSARGVLGECFRARARRARRSCQTRSKMDAVGQSLSGRGGRPIATCADFARQAGGRRAARRECRVGAARGWRVVTPGNLGVSAAGRGRG